MARVNVYLPDDLAREARSAGLNISNVTQEALSRRLTHRETELWIDGLDDLPRLEIRNERILAALDGARAELGEGRQDA